MPFEPVSADGAIYIYKKIFLIFFLFLPIPSSVMQILHNLLTFPDCLYNFLCKKIVKFSNVRVFFN